MKNIMITYGNLINKSINIFPFSKKIKQNVLLGVD